MSPSYLLLTCCSAMQALKQIVDSYSHQTFLDIPERLLLATYNSSAKKKNIQNIEKIKDIIFSCGCRARCKSCIMCLSKRFVEIWAKSKQIRATVKSSVLEPFNKLNLIVTI